MLSIVRLANCIQNAPHAIDRSGAAVGDGKAQVRDRFVSLHGDFAKIPVVADERLPGVIRLVFLLQVDESSHSRIVQRMQPREMLCLIRLPGVCTSEQLILHHPIGSISGGLDIGIGKFTRSVQCMNPSQ